MILAILWKKNRVNLCAAGIFRVGFSHGNDDFFFVKSRSSVFFVWWNFGEPLVFAGSQGSVSTHNNKKTTDSARRGDCLSNWELRNRAKIKTILSVSFRLSKESYLVLDLNIETLCCKIFLLARAFDCFKKIQDSNSKLDEISMCKIVSHSYVKEQDHAATTGIHLTEKGELKIDFWYLDPTDI